LLKAISGFCRKCWEVAAEGKGKAQAQPTAANIHSKQAWPKEAGLVIAGVVMMVKVAYSGVVKGYDKKKRKSSSA